MSISTMAVTIPFRGQVESFSRGRTGFMGEAAAGESKVAAATLAEKRAAICAALAAGRLAEARALLAQAHAEHPATCFAPEWAELGDIDAWADAWLVAAVRGDPPDEAALDVLAARHWRSLFARCQMLVLNREKAGDLAQDAWCRVLRVRHALKPEGNFAAYLATVATNLWRDRHRAARRAGDMAEERLLSLQAAVPTADGAAGLRLQDLVPDSQALQAGEQRRLQLDLDQALAQLPPLLHEVLLARFLEGESCAEIGRRHGRTEQTVSAWVREAVRQMKASLAESPSGMKGGHP
jgi:RNA polymerase sigma factor (sigma-70 family)